MPVWDRITSKYHRYKRERTALAASVTPAPADLLLWPREPGHLTSLIPVATTLAAGGLTPRFVACQSGLIPLLSASGQAAVYTRAAWPERIQRQRKEALGAAETLSVSPGVDFSGFPGSVSPERILNICRQVLVPLLPVVHETVAAVEGAIERMKPGVVVVGNDLTPEGRTACLLLRRVGVPTACFMHGVITGNPQHGRHVADRVLVYGEAARSELLELGSNPEGIATIGAPHLDQRPNQTGAVHPQIASALGPETAQPTVLIATSGPGHSVSETHHRRFVNAVARLSTTMPEVRFLVKLHRKDRVSYYQEAEQAVAGSRLLVVEHGDSAFPKAFEDWLQGCRLLITGASAAAVDAMLMDVPVVTVDLMDELGAADFIRAGVTVHVRSESELAEAVRTLLRSPDTFSGLRHSVREFLVHTFGELDGRAAERGASALRDLIKGGTSR